MWQRTLASPLQLLEHGSSDGFRFVSSTARRRGYQMRWVSLTQAACVQTSGLHWQAAAARPRRVLRHLTRWIAARRSSRAARFFSMSLKRPKARRTLRAAQAGTLTRPTTTAVFCTPPSSRASRVDLHDVRSWNVSYGATPAAWVVTSSAWCARCCARRCEGPCAAVLTTRVPLGTACAAQRLSMHLCLRQLPPKSHSPRAVLLRLR